MTNEMVNEIMKNGMRMVNGVVLVNCTPHDLNIAQMDGQVLTIKPCGIVPRCKSTEELDHTIGMIAVTKQHLGDVEGLPEEIPGVHFIVSRLVASAASNREDLLVPGALVRDDKGKVIGCNGLSLL